MKVLPEKCKLFCKYYKKCNKSFEAGLICRRFTLSAVAKRTQKKFYDKCGLLWKSKNVTKEPFFEFRPEYKERKIT